MSSARRTTSIPGRAQVSSPSRRFRRRFPRRPLFFTITAPIAPSAPAATANPPKIRFVPFFIFQTQNPISVVNTGMDESTRVKSDFEIARLVPDTMKGDAVLSDFVIVCT